MGGVYYKVRVLVISRYFIFSFFCLRCFCLALFFLFLLFCFGLPVMSVFLACYRVEVESVYIIDHCWRMRRGENPVGKR
jgi:hypothetical protein